MKHYYQNANFRSGLERELSVFYACQLLVVLVLVVYVYLTRQWALTMAIQFLVISPWIVFLILRQPLLLYHIDPYMILSFALWMHVPFLLFKMSISGGIQSEDILVKAVILILIGFGSLCAGLCIQINMAEFHKCPDINSKKIFLAGVISLLMSIPLRIYSNSFIGFKETPVFLNYLLVFAVPAVGFLLVAFISQKSTITLVLLCMATLSVLLDTSRRALATIAFIYLFVWFFVLLRKHYGRLPRQTLAWILLFAVVVFFGAIARRAQTRASVREDGFKGDFADNLHRIRDLNTIPNLLYAIEIYPAYFPFEKGQTILALLINPIPRPLWSNKPPSMSSIIAFRQNGYYGQIDYTTEEWKNIGRSSFSVTFIGEMWANFGWLGVLLGPFVLAVIARYLESRFTISRLGCLSPLYMGTLAGAIVIQHRGDLICANYYLMCVLLFGTGTLLAISMITPKFGRTIQNLSSTISMGKLSCLRK